MELIKLRPCDSMWGRCEIQTADPRISQEAGAVYMPYKDDGIWGLFSRDGMIVEGSVDYHGPNASVRNHLTTTPLEFPEGLDQAQDNIYLYGGVINPHYGHFLLNTLPRLWPLARRRFKGIKILCHGSCKPRALFEIYFVKEIFGLLDLTESDFSHFDHPTKIPQIIVPYPSFQEQHFVHWVYGELCGMIGQISMGTRPIGIVDRPAYISKTRLRSGVGRVVNEPDIVGILERFGVDIVYPELLSFNEQLRIFAERSLVAGFTGSAFHTTLFAPSRTPAVCICPTSGPNSNFFLTDRVSQTQTRYFYPPGSRVAVEENSDFLTSMVVEDPASIASDILTLMGIDH